MNKAKTNKNTFKEYQEQKQAVRVELIETYLETLKKNKIGAPNITALANMVADHISRAEGEECNASTMLRNKRYKDLLLSYLAERVRLGTTHLKVSQIESPIARAMVLSSELELINYKNENIRLKTYIKDLENQVQAIEGNKTLINVDLDASQDKLKKSLEDYIFRYAQVCKTLSMVLESLHLFVHVNMNTKTIQDPSKRRDNVIVGAEQAASYFDWLENNKLSIKATNIQ